MVSIMLQGPQWFFGLDATLEIIGGIVALLIVLASYRYAKMAKDKRYGALGGGFLLIFLSFISQVVTSLFIYREAREIGESAYHQVIDITNILYTGHVAHVFFFISGLIVLAIWALRIQDKMQRAFVVAMVLFLAVLGVTNPTIYNLTALILLTFISAKFFLNATAQNSGSAWEVLTGFALITLAQLAFMLEPLNPDWYVGGHIAQVIGYLILLLVLIQVVRK